MIKKFFAYTIGSLFLVMFFSISVSFAEEILCENLIFNIEGQQQVISGKQYEYKINVEYQSLTWNDEILEQESLLFSWSIDGFLQYVLQNSKINLRILKNAYVKENIFENNIKYTFTEDAIYLITASIDFNDCHYNLEKSISVFDESHVYIWNFMDIFNSDIDKTIEQNNILLQTNFVSTETQKDKEKFDAQLEQQINYLQDTKDLFFYIDNYGLLFNALHKFQENWQLQLDDKKIFLISNVNKTVIKKFMAKFIKEANINSIYVINTQEFDNILFNLSIGKTAYSYDFLKENNLDIGTYKLSYTLSHLLDYLVYHGFPLEILTIFLAISLAVLVIVFFKQVIGFSSFGVFYPLLFGFALHTVGLKTSIGMLLTAFLAVFVVKFLAKKINILISAKTGLIIILYTLFSLLGIALYKILWFSQNEFIIFTNPMIMIAFIAILMVGKKLWNKVFPFRSLQRWKSTIWFGILSFGTYIILSSAVIHEYLLIRPWIVILALFLTFGLGRFTWLQVVEFFRFAPLLKKLRKKNN